MMIDARNITGVRHNMVRRREMYDVISHSISSSVMSYAFGFSDRADQGVNDLEQK